MNPAAELPASLQSNAQESSGWLLAFAGSLIVSLLIVAPFFWRGVASGHDFEFHATSWLDVVDQWKDGILYPRWMEWANHGFGEPRFIFYPPLSWLLAPALSRLVPWEYVPVAFIIVVQTLAGLAAFAFARRLVSPGAAVFAAMFYAGNPNALLMIYFRSDYAELLASAFFPLLFLAALRLTGLLEFEAQSPSRDLILFSVAFAGVWLSNAPAGVMATYSVTLLFVWAAFARRKSTLLIRGAVGLALGFGLAGFYLVPAAYEQRWVNIAQALAPGLLPSENFLYTAGNDPEHTFFNYIASSIAVLLMLLTGIAAIAARRNTARISSDAKDKLLWPTFLVIAAVASVLMLRFTGLAWQLLPKLRFVQFPWRWMSILTIPLVYFLAVTWNRGRWRWLWVIAVAAALAATGNFLVRHTWWDDEEFITLRAAIASGEGFEGTDEYDPVEDDHYNLPQKAPAAAILPYARESSARDPSDSTAAKLFFNEWTSESRELQIVAPDRARLALRLLTYPAWHVDVNGSTVSPEHAEDSGQMLVPVPAGESLVTVRFTRTWDRTAGGALSVISVFAALVLVVKARRRKAPPFG
jgi:hypothetical protein